MYIQYGSALKDFSQHLLNPKEVGLCLVGLVEKPALKKCLPLSLSCVVLPQGEPGCGGEEETAMGTG